MGKKYETKYNDNPPPGIYNVEAADSMLYSKSQSALIKEDLIPEKRAQEPTPEPGQYDSTLKGMGQDKMPNIDFGRKYETKYNDNPPPGLYNTEAADSLLYTKTPSVMIREEMTAE